MSRWIPIWLQLQEKELFRTENNKDILTHLEQNLLVIEKSSIAPDKTIAELCRSISMLQEHISSECAEPDGCRKDSIAIQMKIPKKETGENTKIILTKEIIKSARTANGGLTKHQLEAIGVAWPPTKGAVDKKIGTEITQEQLQQFMTVKYVEKKT